MNNSSNEKIITDVLQKAQKEGGITLKEKLRKLLVERHIPHIPVIDEVESLRPLGHGVFGIVELIRYKKKLYAHKRARQNTSEQRSGILEEGIKLSDIARHHPNIQRLNFINLRTFGLVIDYCSNGSLDVFVRDKTSNCTLVDVLSWSYQLADALSFLHSYKIIHRDVKMQNILLKDNCQTLVLTDYGTATQLGKSWMTDNVGTPITMAPEVFAYNQYAEQCDIYSWSIVFWQLISKKLLPYGGEGKGFLLSVVQNKLRPPKFNHCPELFIALLYRSWHSDPNERPTLLFIKKVLRLILNTLPKKKQEYTPEIANEIQNQWINEYNLPEKHLPYEPRFNNEQSMNLYQEHLTIMERIMKIQKDITELKQKQATFDHYEDVLYENDQLQKKIDELRSKTVT
ncbi:unnamed protein product [Rotaria sordida]|uniref:Protein kinase domain-containing protein n=1 Tax=Rotaria sordida TaxID=392033 RepID=A0A813ZVT5_9BILA|nr:unnamed protein product [Rotaria sordida]CAF0873170.1 unnamed protein product [Rotaria sordida]CAF0904849.1 unnamed protein product [Rotaria sordida]CAF0918115.1 unnamed protein product [Rotaria sordida]CAF0921086.1 unnamed protein product [Rotaria sordida]